MSEATSVLYVTVVGSTGKILHDDRASSGFVFHVDDESRGVLDTDGRMAVRLGEADIVCNDRQRTVLAPPRRSYGRRTNTMEEQTPTSGCIDGRFRQSFRCTFPEPPPMYVDTIYTSRLTNLTPIHLL